MAKFLCRHNEHDPPIGELPVPHGPETGREHLHYPRRASTSYATDYEKQIFAHLIQPDDSYTSEGVYWADLPLLKRFAFVNKVNGEETRSELKTIWEMVKNDPLSPLSWYIRNSVLPGAGLLLEGYVLFSIGNLEPLFADVWSACWGTKTVCSKNWVASVTYLEIIGIMFGQTGVGVSLSHLRPSSSGTNDGPSRLLGIGLGEDSASSRMLSSCLLVCCYSPVLGVSLCKAGSFYMPFLCSSMVCL
jgi:hypothetical protein